MPIGTSIGVAIVIFLYLFVNVAYVSTTLLTSSWLCIHADICEDGCGSQRISTESKKQRCPFVFSIDIWNFIQG